MCITRVSDDWLSTTEERSVVVIEGQEARKEGASHQQEQLRQRQVTMVRDLRQDVDSRDEEEGSGGEEHRDTCSSKRREGMRRGGERHRQARRTGGIEVGPRVLEGSSKAEVGEAGADRSTGGEGEQVSPDARLLEAFMQEEGHETERRRRLVKHDGEEDDDFDIRVPRRRRCSQCDAVRCASSE